MNRLSPTSERILKLPSYFFSDPNLVCKRVLDAFLDTSEKVERLAENLLYQKHPRESFECEGFFAHAKNTKLIVFYSSRADGRSGFVESEVQSSEDLEILRRYKESVSLLPIAYCL